MRRGKNLGPVSARLILRGHCVCSDCSGLQSLGWTASKRTEPLAKCQGCSEKERRPQRQQHDWQRRDTGHRSEVGLREPLSLPFLRDILNVTEWDGSTFVYFPGLLRRDTGLPLRVRLSGSGCAWTLLPLFCSSGVNCRWMPQPCWVKTQISEGSRDCFSEGKSPPGAPPLFITPWMTRG